MGPSVSSFSSVLPVLLALLLSLIDHQVMSLGIGINIPIPTIIKTPSCAPIKADDRDRIKFILNLEYLFGEYVSYGSSGKGLDSISPGLSNGGPPPIGAQKAFLDDNPVAARIIEEFVYEQVGHIKAINRTVGGIPRPLLDLSRTLFALLFDVYVFKRPLIPPFNPYANSLNFQIVAYVLASYAQTAYVGAIPNLATNSSSLYLASKLAPIKAGQAAIIRTLLYQNATQLVPPYKITVREFTKAIAQTVNDLGKCGIKDEGILLDNTTLGAENRTTTNVLAADYSSLSYARTEPELLRIVYGTGNERLPGAFFPTGANGKIARNFLLL